MRDDDVQSIGCTSLEYHHQAFIAAVRLGAERRSCQETRQSSGPDHRHRSTTPTYATIPRRTESRMRPKRLMREAAFRRLLITYTAIGTARSAANSRYPIALSFTKILYLNPDPVRIPFLLP